MMSRVKSKNTKPELIIRSILHRKGYRFRIHRSDLPGNPDLVLPKYKTALFVDGCFWHQHPGCSKAGIPKSNQEFWSAKLASNVNRDTTSTHQLRSIGWDVIRIWECEIKKDPSEAMLTLLEVLRHPKVSAFPSVIDGIKRS